MHSSNKHFNHNQLVAYMNENEKFVYRVQWDSLKNYIFYVVDTKAQYSA